MLTLGNWTFWSTFTIQVFWFDHSFYENLKNPNGHDRENGKKNDIYSGHYVIASSRPPEWQLLERRTLVPIWHLKKVKWEIFKNFPNIHCRGDVWNLCEHWNKVSWLLTWSPCKCFLNIRTLITSKGTLRNNTNNSNRKAYKIYVTSIALGTLSLLGHQFHMGSNHLRFVVQLGPNLSWSFGPKMNTKFTIENHPPPTHRKLLKGF